MTVIQLRASVSISGRTTVL